MAITYVTNWGEEILASGITAGATSIVLVGVTTLPATPRFRGALWNSTDFAEPGDDPDREMVEATAIDVPTKTLTVVRGQEGTTAKAHNTVGKTYRFSVVVSKGLWEQLIASDSDGYFRGNAGQTRLTFGTRLAYRDGPAWSVTAFGATGSGASDDAPGVKACLDAAPDGATILFDPGTYDLTSWNTSGETYTKRFTFVGGYGGTTTIKGASTKTFLNIGESFECERIRFNGWKTVFNFNALATTKELFHLEKVIFDAVESSLKWDTPTVGGKIETIEVERCRWKNVTSLGCDLAGSWDLAVFSYCNVDGAKTRGFHFGVNVFADQGNWPNVRVIDCRFKNITPGTGATDSAAVFIYGLYGIVSGCRIDGVVGGTEEAWGIYYKCLGGQVLHNIIHGVDGSAGSVGGRSINIKGAERGVTTSPQGYNVIVAGNEVYCGTIAKSTAIAVFNGSIHCYGNICEDFVVDGISTDSNTVHDNIRISGNHLRVATEGTTVGIRLVSRGNSNRADHNDVVNCQTGIRFTPSAGTPRNIRIEDNNIYEGVTGILIGPTVATSYLYIRGNYTESCSSRGISFGSGGTPVDFVWIEANEDNGSAVATGFTVEPTNLTYKNRGQDMEAGLDGWYRDDVAASLTAQILSRGAGQASSNYVCLRPGSLTGVGVFSNAARTAGTLTVEVYKNGTATGLTAILDATNTTVKTTTQRPGLDSFVAGDRLDIRVTTDATWAPVTADIVCGLDVSY